MTITALCRAGGKDSMSWDTSHLQRVLRVGDRVRIASEIVVSVVEISGGRVRLQFDAPRCVPIDRVQPPAPEQPAGVQ